MASLDTTEPVAEESGLPIVPDQPGVAPVAADAHLPFRFTAGASLSIARRESLEAWHRPFLRLAAANLRTTLRLEVELELDSIQVEPCAQVLAARGDSNQGLIFRMAPQPDLWLLDLPLPLAGLVIERMMGGTAATLAEGEARTHELTELEQILFQQFATGLLGDYARNWQPHRELAPEVVRPVRALRVARALGYQPDDLLVRVDLLLVLKSGKAPFSLFLPIAAAEELLQHIGASEDATRNDAPAFTANNKSPVASVPVPVSVRWQGFQITLSEIEALQPGDLLVLDAKKCEQGVVWLGGRARFAGKVARDPQKTFITLTHPLE